MRDLYEIGVLVNNEGKVTSAVTDLDHLKPEHITIQVNKAIVDALNNYSVNITSTLSDIQVNYGSVITGILENKSVA